jgi:hypothetical protein
MSQTPKILPYMLPPAEQHHVTEDYVSSPPALMIFDETGAVWCLDQDMQPGPYGEYAFSVLRNGVRTGAVASRIERRGGKIRVFTSQGWRRWTGTSFF